MKSVLPIITRFIAVFAIFWMLLFIIPYQVLVIGGLAAGLFMYKTSDDRPLVFGLLLGSLFFGIYAFLMAQYFPT